MFEAMFTEPEKAQKTLNDFSPEYVPAIERNLRFALANPNDPAAWLAARVYEFVAHKGDRLKDIVEAIEAEVDRQNK